MAGMQVAVSPGQQWERVQRQLRASADGAALRKALRDRIRAAAKPVQTELAASVRAVHVTGARGGGSAQRLAHGKTPAAAKKRGGGLRETVARALQIKFADKGPRAGVRLRVDGTKLPDGQKGLPKYLDGQGRWRHPVFGRVADAWVEQKGQPWWRPVIEKHMAGIRREVTEAAREAIERTIT